MEKLWQHMLQKLLSSLGTDLTLPKCLQIVGYLRRMEAFTEPELRIRFLQAREEWLTNLLSDISKDDGIPKYFFLLFIFGFNYTFLQLPIT